MAEFYTPDARFTGDAAAQHRANFDADQWRGVFSGALDAYGQERAGYAQGVNQATQQAAAPGLGFQFTDARRQHAFQQARQGTRGGSADLTGQANLQAQYAAGLGNAALQGRAVQQGQEMTDAQRIQALRLMALQQGQPEQALQLQAGHDASQARMGLESSEAQYAQQRYTDRLADAALRSQVLGGQLSQVGRTVNTAGQLGTGPQWMQNWASVLGGGV